MLIYGLSLGLVALGLAQPAHALPPAALGVQAVASGGTTATVSANVFTYGNSTTVLVEYGTTTGYELGTASTIAAGDSSGSTPVSATITGLTAGTTYHYRLTLASLEGTTQTGDYTYVHDPCTTGTCPAILSARTTSVGTTGARVEANLFTRGQSTTWWIEYGPTASYGSSTTHETQLAEPYPLAVELTGLAPRTTYHYRVVAENASGRTTSGDLTFDTLDPCTLGVCPEITSLEAEPAIDGAMVEAHIYTRGSATSWSVEWGTTPALGSSQAGPQLPGDTSGASSVALPLTGLQPRTTYHFRIVATNANGPSASPVSTFTTLDPCDFNMCPQIVDVDVVPQSLDSASVQVRVLTRGEDTTLLAEYGTTTAYGTSVAGPVVPGDTSGSTDVTIDLAGLTANTTYHLRVSGTNVHGTGASDDVTFSIDPCTLDLCLLIQNGFTHARDVEHDTAVVETSIVTRGLATTWRVEYGTTTGYGSSVDGPPIPGDQTGGSAVAVRLEGLTPLTTYHYRVVAESAAGPVTGPDKTFTTGAPPDPCEEAQCPEGSLEVGSRSSQRVFLRGQLFTYGSATTWAVEYGPGFGLTAPGTTVPGDATSATEIEIEITGLTVSTTYPYRIVATNAAGTKRSGASTFTTTNGFTNLEALHWLYGPDMPKPWYAFTATELNGRIWLTGNDPLGRVYSLDPFATVDEWTLEPGTTPYYTQEEGSAALDGKLWLLGAGHPVGSPALSDVVTQIYDPATDAWSLGAALPDQRPRFGAQLVAANGTLYVFGGRNIPGPGTAELYDDAWRLSADRSEWLPVPTPPQPVSDAATATGVDGRIYFFGGVRCTGAGSVPGTKSCEGGEILDLVQIFDPATETWSSGAPLPAPRYGAAAERVGLGILVVGGLDALPTDGPDQEHVYPPALRRVDVYEYLGDRWLSSPQTLDRREEHAVVSVGRELWVVGGRSAQPLSSVEYVTAEVIASAVPQPAAPDGDGGWYRTTPQIRVDASNGVGGPAQLVYGFGTAAAYPYAGPVLVPVPDGTQTFRYRAIDAVGNTIPEATRTLKVDTVAPEVTLARLNAATYRATVTDGTSGAARVEFRAVTPSGTVALPTDTAAPFELDASLVPVDATAVEAVAFDAAGNSATVSASPTAETTLELTGATSGAWGDPAQLAAVLMDVNGDPIAGEEVTLAVGWQTCTATTTATGTATCTITPIQPAGTYPLTATYAGGDVYLGSTASGTFAIVRETAALSWILPPWGVEGATLVKVKLSDESGALVGKPVTFTSGSVSKTTVTVWGGYAIALLPLSAGVHTVTATFSGDAYYAPVSISRQVTVGKLTSFVVWGGNAGGLDVGDQPVFWGSKWYKQVTGGSYSAHADFKGYANDVDGLRWEAKAGNSKPPSSIPQYIVVIVSTDIDKDRSTIEGNVAGLALLRVVNPGDYKKAPAKDIRGEVVTVFAP